MSIYRLYFWNLHSCFPLKSIYLFFIEETVENKSNTQNILHFLDFSTKIWITTILENDLNWDGYKVKYKSTNLTDCKRHLYENYFEYFL
jgi:hypothetical protein